jgi:hypothetical protein
MMLGPLVYCVNNYASAESRVRAACAEVEKGMPVGEAAARLASRGMGPAPKPEGTSYVVEERTFGRFGCKLTVEAGNVVSAEYSFAD